MQVELKSDFPVTDEACRQATGKSLSEWSDAIAANADIASKRREAINWVCDQIGRSTEGVWWATTIWVEHEKRIGRLQKDGRPEGYNICCTKSITAPLARVQEALATRVGTVTRLREGKDIRATWRTEGAGADTEIDLLLKEAGGKTAITLNHNRILTREEADGLRKAWAVELASLKADLE